MAWARMRARRRRPSPARQRGSIRRRRKERRPRRRPAGTREGAGGKRRRSAGLGRAGPGSVRFGGTGRAPARRGGPSPRRRFPAPLRSPRAPGARPAAPRVPLPPRRRHPDVPLSGSRRFGAGSVRRAARFLRRSARTGSSPAAPFVSRAARGAERCGAACQSARAAPQPRGPGSARLALCALLWQRGLFEEEPLRKPIETGSSRGSPGKGEIGVRLLARCVKLNAAPRGFCGARARLQLQLPPALSPGSTAERRDGFPLSNLPGYPSRAAICLPVFSLPCRHRSGCRRLSGRSGRTCRENGGGAQRRAPLGFVSAVLAGNTSVSAHTVSANGVCVCVCFCRGNLGANKGCFYHLLRAVIV